MRNVFPLSMYAAIAHQMEKGTTVETLRSQAGQFLRVNAEEFAPFITDPKTGDMLTAEQFEEYCNQVENSPAWGGQPEVSYFFSFLIMTNYLQQKS